MDTGSPRCRLIPYVGPRPSISLGFELENAGDKSWTGDVHEPIMPRAVRAWVDGREVAVRVPAFDLQVRKRGVQLEPGERIELACPVVLVFDEADASRSPFVWTLATAPAAVELDATIVVSGVPCTTPRTTVPQP